MSSHLSERSAEKRAGNGRGPETAAADAADVAGAGGPQAAVHVRREQPHRHARRAARSTCARRSPRRIRTGGTTRSPLTATVFKTPQTITLTGTASSS